MNHYIRLLTTEELSDDEMGLWFDTVSKFAPGGTVIIDDQWDDDSDEDFEVAVSDDEDFGDDDFPYIYEVDLTRHLEKEEAEFIVAAWDMRFADDYEIETSNLYTSEVDPQSPLDVSVDNEIKERIENTAAKFLHNRWVEKRIQEGWRFGLHSNKEQKVSPLLRDWDSLDESYRKHKKLSEKEALDFYVKYNTLFK